MRRDVAGRRVLITGASSGIGRTWRCDWRSLGAKVALAARSEDKLHELAHELNGAGAESGALLRT